MMLMDNLPFVLLMALNLNARQKMCSLSTGWNMLAIQNPYEMYSLVGNSSFTLVWFKFDITFSPNSSN